MQITQPSDYVGYKNRHPSPHDDDDDEKHGYYHAIGRVMGWGSIQRDEWKRNATDINSHRGTAANLYSNFAI